MSREVVQSQSGRPKRRFPILLNCEQQQFVSCTSNLLEQTYDFTKSTMFLQMPILNLQDLPQSQNLETIPVCIVLQCFPHDNMVCVHMYDEYTKSIDSGVCHKSWSILWLIVQVCSLTIEYKALQFVPSVNIAEQFGSTLVTTLQQWAICVVVDESKCLATPILKFFNL